MKERVENVDYSVHVKARETYYLPAFTSGGDDIEIAGEPAKVVSLNASDDQEAIDTVQTIYGVLNIDKLVVVEHGVEREVMIPLNADDDGWDKEDDDDFQDIEEA